MHNFLGTSPFHIFHIIKLPWTRYFSLRSDRKPHPHFPSPREHGKNGHLAISSAPASFTSISGTYIIHAPTSGAKPNQLALRSTPTHTVLEPDARDKGLSPSLSLYIYIYILEAGNRLHTRLFILECIPAIPSIYTTACLSSPLSRFIKHQPGIIDARPCSLLR